MPAAKPARVKELAGNPGHRRIHRGPEAGTLSLRAPNGLPRRALEEWRRIAPRLVAMGIAGDVDRQALADYCVCVARLAEAEADIQARGILVEGDRGMVKNPSCQLARDYRADVIRWAQQFGLTPSSRGRLDVPEPKPVDEFAAYLQKSGVMAKLDEPEPEPDMIGRMARLAAEVAQGDVLGGGRGDDEDDGAGC